MDRNKIIKFCEDYLKVKDFQDYCHNGLQVEGIEDVKRIITGVSLSQKLIKKAIEKKAQIIIVHHGIFGDQMGTPPKIHGIIKDRIKLLLENNINLCGFHLPLDAHPVIGNNISLCTLLGVKKAKPFYVGFIGELDKAVDIKEFVDIVNKKLNVKSFVLANGIKKIKKIAIISGGASSHFEEVRRLGADLYVCGDMKEHIVRGSEEAQINIINAGHYNTEKMGVKNLGNLIAKKFKIDVEFVDVPCEI